MAALLLAALLGCSDPEPPAPTLTSDSADARKEALYAMSLAERRAALPTLLTMATEDPDSSVRQLAIAFAGTTGDPAAVPVLVEILHDWSDGGSQLAAATALGNQANGEACEAMLDALLQWPQPPRDMIVNELRAAIVRTPDPCERHVRARMDQWPDEMREIVHAMNKRR